MSLDDLPQLESIDDILIIPRIYASPPIIEIEDDDVAVEVPLFLHPHIASVNHFQINDVLTRKAHSRRAPKFSESKIYIKNPAPSSLLVDNKHALHLTDDDGRSYWNATNKYNNCNCDWVINYMNSSRYEHDDCILLAKCKSGDTNYTSLPGVGQHTFLSSVNPPSIGPSSIGRTYALAAEIVHTSHYARGTRARKTCYIVIRGGFHYDVNILAAAAD